METVENQQDASLITFVYGWGRLCRLYHDYLDIHGLTYAVADLVYVRPTYQRVMGIPSARLTLRFREHDIVLRGISDVQAAQKAVIHLNTLCGESVAPIWKAGKSPWSDPLQQISGTLPPMPQEYSPITAYESNLKDMAQAPTTPIAVSHRGLTHRVGDTLKQPRPQLAHTLCSYGFDVAQLAQQLKSEPLPEQPIPIRLLPNEHAHYVTDATRRTPQANVNTSVTSISLAGDQGMLILSNKRIIYIGRTGQMLLDYAQLTQIFRLPDAISFAASHWTQRETFDMPRPLECAMYLETILRHFQHTTFVQHDEYATERMARLWTSGELPRHSTRLAIDHIDTQPLSHMLSEHHPKQHITQHHLNIHER